MDIRKIDVRNVGVIIAAALLVGRGVWEAFTLVFLSGSSTESFLLSLTIMLSVSSILFLIGRSLKRRQELGWQAALTVTFILATTNMIFLSSGYPQPIYEYLLDALLIAFLIANRSLFFNTKVKPIRKIIQDLR